ncbi:DUF58 domain-containing protein [Planctellipticum variicoloris]|uniref:DUF58 domain-containing protein n=1 Tax=Planctellipticum variicoloris TaxID=3064265 RepID=UPI003013B3F5|nr:DUF58 domain-containing protein [Planctomycetaceae bacterium SH412]
MSAESGPRSFLDVGVLSRLAAMPLFARRPMQGNVSGRHASPHRGASVEFAEYRKYVPGDDLRRLDWRAYGRSDRFYVKEFEADTNLRCCLVLDTSGSMGFGSTGVTKIEYARRVAGTLAYLASQQGDAVGLACVAGGVVQNLPPKRNAAHLRLALDILERTQPRGETQLAAVLHELAETVRQRALIVILSDLFIEPSILRSSFQHLRFRHHDVAVFHLLDPQELAFNFRRPMRFLDMEGGAAIFAEPNDIADRYDRALQQYLVDLRQVMLESGVDYQRVSIDESYEQVLARFLVGRAQAKGLR